MIEKIYWSSEIDDNKKSKKECKKIAEEAKLAIKYLDKVEIFSEKENRVVSTVTDSEEGIIPGWCGIDFIIDEPFAEYMRTYKIPKLQFGIILDPKDDKQSIEVLEKIIV